MGLPHEQLTTDIHCVTKWSKLDTAWNGVSVDVLLEGIDTAAQHALVHPRRVHHQPAPGGPDRRPGLQLTATTGRRLDPEHGGPARLLVPHLYFWKSAKWVRAIELRDDDHPGF